MTESNRYGLLSIVIVIILTSFMAYCGFTFQKDIESQRLSRERAQMRFRDPYAFRYRKQQQDKEQETEQ